MIFCFLMEIKMPLVIQGLLNSFFVVACLSVTREKRLDNSLKFSMVRGG